MSMARIASQRATCFRLNVGAIITHENNPVSIGWNGHEAGAPHCAGNACPGITPGNCGTIHAEANALIKAAALLPDNSNVDLYVTNSPCPTCANHIRESGLYVRRVFFEIPYRERQHLSYAFEGPYTNRRKDTRVTNLFEVTPAGYVVEYFSRKVMTLV